MRFSQIRTPGGYLCGEVASALQKAIRRGPEREAPFWATELDLAGYGAYVWKRLRIIAGEDVGLADSNVTVQVRALYGNWVEMRKQVKEERYAGVRRVFLVHVVRLLARAPKSRMLDHVLMVMYDGEQSRSRSPTTRLTAHSPRQGDGRSKRHFFDEAARLENATLPDSYEAEARQAFLHGDRRRRRTRISSTSVTSSSMMVGSPSDNSRARASTFNVKK